MRGLIFWNFTNYLSGDFHKGRPFAIHQISQSIPIGKSGTRVSKIMATKQLRIPTFLSGQSFFRRILWWSEFLRLIKNCR